MQIIRTACVELSIIPALAYKHKVEDNKTILCITRLDKKQIALFLVQKPTGELKALQTVNSKYFPPKAIYEAIQRLEGELFYLKYPVLLHSEQKYVEVTKNNINEQQIEIINSFSYKTFVHQYSDSKGCLDINRLNATLIQMAMESQIVLEMLKQKKLVETIINYLVEKNIMLYTGAQSKLTKEQLKLFIDLLQDTEVGDIFSSLKQFVQNMSC